MVKYIYFNKQVPLILIDYSYCHLCICGICSYRSIHAMPTTVMDSNQTPPKNQYYGQRTGMDGMYPFHG